MKRFVMRHVVIGGGIAGVCCVEELCRLQPSHEVTLISSSTILKVRAVLDKLQTNCKYIADDIGIVFQGVESVIKITKTIEEVLGLYCGTALSQLCSSGLDQRIELHCIP